METSVDAAPSHLGVGQGDEHLEACGESAAAASGAPPGMEAVAEVCMKEADDQYGDGEGEEEEGEEEEEESGSSSSSEEDRREYGIYQCLPVEPGEPDWSAEEATTVEEYLRRVRYEAQHLPDVVAAAPPPPPAQHGAAGAQQVQRAEGQVEQREHYSSRYLAADPGVTPCDPSLKPSASWTRDFLQQFAQLRRRLQREHELMSAQAAAALGAATASSGLLSSGVVLDAAAVEELAALKLDSPSDAMPELRQLQGLDQLQVRRQLHSTIRQVVREEGVAPEAAALLYALSARIEKPLHAGTCALYRQLLRLCAARRAELPSPADPRLPHLNILIAVAGAFFGQDEELAAMWDDDGE